MGATEEQMALVASVGIDHVAYILILYSLAFLTFLFVNLLVYLYDRNANSPTKAAPVSATGRVAFGSRGPENTQLRDAEEFELDGLMSEDDDEESATRRKLLKEDDDVDAGLGSPNTVGRNSDRVA